VLVLERTGVAGAWQFPQGGLKADETPHEGVLREIQEETGLRSDQLTLIARASRPLAYELPIEMRSRKTGIGQVHYWYLFRLVGDADVKLPSEGEFRDARWVTLSDATASAAPFRQLLYKTLLDEFSPFLPVSSSR
jgi:putative (di)nucleoside polyphosphate hydrolase